jgi:hypothetical protein
MSGGSAGGLGSTGSGVGSVTSEGWDSGFSYGRLGSRELSGSIRMRLGISGMGEQNFVI